MQDVIVIKTDIIEGLQALGICEDDRVLVHSSLSSLGWVAGGAQAVVEALLATIPQGTIFMPAQTGDNSEPSYWQNPPVNPAWHPIIREQMPAYDKKLSIPRKMGKIVETFLYLDGIKRSNHPQVSFCGFGRDAEHFLKNHQLDYGLYKNTPVEKFYVEDVKVVLLGVDYDRCTVMHYAEYENPQKVELAQGFAYLDGGKRIWRESKEIDLDSDVFPKIGKLLEESNQVTQGKIGKATVKVFSAKAAIDTAIAYYKGNLEG